MYYAKFEELENMKKLVPLNCTDKDNKDGISGLPMGYENSNIYVDSNISNSLIIGGNNSLKTQLITLPMLHLSASASESVVICPKNKDVYETSKKTYEDRGYKVIKIDFDDLDNSNHWNILDLPCRLYKQNKKDIAQDLIENVAFYLLGEKYNPNQDPFWVNSAINYFTGITLYTFENNDYTNLMDVMKTDEKVRENPSEFLSMLDKNSNIYINLVGILSAPVETRGSILSVFNQKLKQFISRDSFNKMTSSSDFDITKICSDKTIVYLLSEDSTLGNYLMPLFINQLYFAKKDNNKLNVIVEEFSDFYPIAHFSKILDNSRAKGINFTIIVRSFRDLYIIYGKEEVEIFKMLFKNIVYLISSDPDTLNVISNLCGKKEENGNVVPLITEEQLRVLSKNEAIIITQRIMPFKTKLLPYKEFVKNN